MRYLCSAIIAMFSIHLCLAQSFDYSVQRTTGSFSYLSQKTILSENEDWKSHVITIPIGFNYNFLDSIFDTLTIESNGFIVFEGNRQYALAAFNEIIPIVDTSGEIKSTISYFLEGNDGSRILKIEYKNCGFLNDGTDESFSYQIWLYESGGKAEVRIGSGNSAYPSDIGISPIIGLINMNRDTEITGFLIYGDPLSPQSKSMNLSEELVYLSAIPAEGTIYSFIPQP